jgi:hypothetical protein
MDAPHAAQTAKGLADKIPGYDYGSSNIARSPISSEEFELMKKSAGFTTEDQRWLRTAGDVLVDQTKALVEKWRSVIAAHPFLAKHSLGPDGERIPRYSEASGLRFEQWILDTCLRPYDQDWLNYQQEIALRHTSVKKNQTDRVQSSPAIPLRHLIAFTAILIDPEIMKPFLRARNHSGGEIEKMLRAWNKSLLLQIALWSEPYTDTMLAPDEW